MQTPAQARACCDMRTCGNEECGSVQRGVEFPSDTQCAIKSKLQTRATANVVVDGHRKKGPPKMALCCSVIMDCWNDSVLYNNSYKQYLSQKQTLCGKVVSEVLKQK